LYNSSPTNKRCALKKAERKNMLKKVKNKFKKIKWKKLLSATLALLLVVGAIAGIAALVSKDTKKISSFAFTRGSLDESGNFVKGETSIVTEDLFECQGLTIEPEFKASGIYQVFYYDSNESFLGVTEKINTDDGMYEKGDSFVLAKYARIVITPDSSANTEDGEEFKIRFWETAKYAREYVITVNKKQTFKYNNACIWDKSMNGKHYNIENGTGKLIVTPYADCSSSKLVDVTSSEEITVYIPVEVNDKSHLLIFLSDTTTVSYYTLLGENLTPTTDGTYYIYTLSVPADATFVVLPLWLEAASSYGIVLG
jgi:hypothetical protein